MSAELVGKYPNDPEVLRDYILELESRLASARECLSGVLNHAGEAHYNDCAYCDDEEAECTCGSAKYYDLARNWLASEKIEKKDV